MDGKVDCPYDFDDRTTHSNGSSTYSGSYFDFTLQDLDTTTLPTIQKVAEENNIVQENKTEESKSVNHSIYFVFAILSILVIWLALSNILKNDKNKTLSDEISVLRKDNANLVNQFNLEVKKRNSEERFCATPFLSEINEQKEIISTLKTDLAEKTEKIRGLNIELKKRNDTINDLTGQLDSKEKKIYEVSSQLNNCLIDLEKLKKQSNEICKPKRVEQLSYINSSIRQSRIPKDVTIAFDGMPIYWKFNPEKPYGDYTVYINEKTGIYHVDRFCSSYSSRKAHIFNVIDHARPCKRCAEGFFDFSTVPEWFIK